MSINYSEEKLNKIKEFFKADIFAADTGAVIDSVGAGCAVCSLKINSRHYNAGGGVQGGVIFTLADFTFAVAANSGGNLTVSLSNNITFLRPPKSDTIKAEAKLISETKHTCLYEVNVTDSESEGSPVAVMTVNGYKKSVPIEF